MTPTPSTPIPHPVMPDLIRHPASSWIAEGSETPDQVRGDDGESFKGNMGDG